MHHTIYALPICGNGIDNGRALGQPLILDLKDPREPHQQSLDAAKRAYGLAPNDRRRYLYLTPFGPDPKERGRCRSAIRAWLALTPMAAIAHVWRKELDCRERFEKEREDARNAEASNENSSVPTGNNGDGEGSGDKRLS